MSDVVNLGANIIAYEKDHVRYGMTCAWCTHVDYDELIMLLGSQSDTGNHLEIGDKVGVSALSHTQKELALHFGENHSGSTDKFANQTYKTEDGAITFPGARTEMICEVYDITHIKGNPDDRLVLLKILAQKEDRSLRFLCREEIA